MDEEENNFQDNVELEDSEITTVTSRLKKITGKNSNAVKTKRSSVLKNPEKIIWNSESEHTKTPSPFRNFIKDRTIKKTEKNSGYRVRKVRRLIRHIEPWSALKVSLIFYTCIWGLVTIAVRILWNTADDAGTIDKTESFIEDLFALEVFEFDAEQIFRIFFLGGLVLVVGGTALTVILVVLFNLISDLTGGVRFTMIEEETAVRRRKLRSDD